MANASSCSYHSCVYFSGWKKSRNNNLVVFFSTSVFRKKQKNKTNDKSFFQFHILCSIVKWRSTSGSQTLPQIKGSKFSTRLLSISSILSNWAHNWENNIFLFSLTVLTTKIYFFIFCLWFSFKKIDEGMIHRFKILIFNGFVSKRRFSLLITNYFTFCILQVASHTQKKGWDGGGLVQHCHLAALRDDWVLPASALVPHRVVPLPPHRWQKDLAFVLKWKYAHLYKNNIFW